MAQAGPRWRRSVDDDDSDTRQTVVMGGAQRLGHRSTNPVLSFCARLGMAAFPSFSRLVLGEALCLLLLHRLLLSCHRSPSPLCANCARWPSSCPSTSFSESSNHTAVTWRRPDPCLAPGTRHPDAPLSNRPWTLTCGSPASHRLHAPIRAVYEPRSTRTIVFLFKRQSGTRKHVALAACLHYAIHTRYRLVRRCCTHMLSPSHCPATTPRCASFSSSPIPSPKPNTALAAPHAQVRSFSAKHRVAALQLL